MFHAVIRSMIEGSRRVRFGLATFLNGAILTLFANGSLMAKEKEEIKEPLWVISWAVFFLFLGITLFFLTKPTKRRDTVLNEEEEKEFEEKLAAKKAALVKEEKDVFEEEI